MSDALYFLDVNVPMYAAGAPHGYKEACIWVLTEVADGRLAVAIDTEIIQEILYRYGALNAWSVGVEMATALLDLVPIVLPVTSAEMHTAVHLFGQFAPQGIKARDIIHAAVMHHHDVTHIISTDRHFDALPNITRHDPVTLMKKRRPT